MNKHNYIVHIYEKQQTECCKFKKKIKFSFKVIQFNFKKMKNLENGGLIY